MTRDQVELICKNVRELGRLGWEADKLQMNDAEQRQIIDEQVEENRGLRADVLLMQKANAEQCEEITRLREALANLLAGNEDYIRINNLSAMGNVNLIAARQALTQEPT